MALLTIDEQLQQLIQQAPTDMELELQTLAPVLGAVAGRLQHLQYYLLQSLDQNWVMTTLQHRTQPDLTKTVIYAYPSLEAAKAKATVGVADTRLVALPVPTVQLLFQLLAIEPVESLVFLEQSQHPGIEISRKLLQDLVSQRLIQPLPPPDIA